MYLIVIAWLYVVLMMAVAEANHANGTLLGAFFTFVLYGVGPVALVVYLLGGGMRRRAREFRAARAAAEAQPPASTEPDGGGETTTGAVAPMRKEP